MLLAICKVYSEIAWLHSFERSEIAPVYVIDNIRAVWTQANMQQKSFRNNIWIWNADTALCAKQIRFTIAFMLPFHLIMRSFHLIMHSFHSVKGSFRLVMRSLYSVLWLFKSVPRFFHLVMFFFHSVMGSFHSVMYSFHSVIRLSILHAFHSL